jgi:hypothetical protein
MIIEATLAIVGKFLLEFYQVIAQVFYGTILWPISSMRNLILTGILWFILVVLILRIRQDRMFRLE